MACFMSVSIHFGQYNCCVYIWYSLAPSHSRARERARVNHLALLHLCTCFNHFNLKHKRMYLSINVIIEYNHFARANKEQENSHSTHSFRCVLYLAPIFVWVLDTQKNYICVIRLEYEMFYPFMHQSISFANEALLKFNIFQCFIGTIDYRPMNDPIKMYKITFCNQEATICISNPFLRHQSKTIVCLSSYDIPEHKFVIVSMCVQELRLHQLCPRSTHCAKSFQYFKHENAFFSLFT